MTALAAAVALSTGALLAQRYSFRHYGQSEGLKNLAIECLLQDETGFLWVGTQNGLFRLDGRRFHEIVFDAQIHGLKPSTGPSRQAGAGPDPNSSVQALM